MKDSVARNALTRFEGSLSKKFAAQLEGFDEAGLRELEQLKEIFEFLDDVSSGSEEEIDINTVVVKKPSSKRSTTRR